MEAIAITDHANVDGTIRWQEACKEEGIKSIIGCEMYIVPNMLTKQKGEKRGHITLLVKNQKGWHSLLKMLTMANLDGFYNRPRIDYDNLLNNINNGLIVLTGCGGSFLTLPGDGYSGEAFLHNLISKKIDCYLEVMPHCILIQKEVNNLCLKLFKEYNIPLIATNDCHYILKDQWKAQEVLLAIQRKAKWNDKNRWKFGFTGLHLRTEEEMIIEFEKQGILSKRQCTIAILNTHKVAEQCWDFKIPKLEPELPFTRYEKGGDETPAEILDHFCRSTFFEGSTKVPWNEIYQERYQYEYKIIQKKNLARYFLIIYELVEWCKQNDIPVGPGRGSVGGSLIAFLLGITRVVDPIKYDLLFERFINEDRVDLPDVDLDFDRNKIHLVKKHLEDEYGEYNVAGINTFMSMQARAAIRDVGRVFDLPSKEIDELAKSVNYSIHEKNYVLHTKDVQAGKTFFQKYPEEFQLMCDLEGQIRGSGQHPSGLIVSGKDLRDTDRCNLSMRDNTKVINWEMNDSEYAGLTKIDALKLGTLTVLQETKRLIGNNFEFEDLTFDDPAIFEMLSKGETAGVFQMTGYACTKLGMDVKIDNFNDIVAIIALARPGPLKSKMAEEYVKRKHGQKWKAIHPIYEEITKETYGVIAYQEQVMKVMINIAGFSGSDADQIRKIIGKKRNVKEFEPYREAFMKGCQKQKTLNEKQANEFWQGLLKHASYSFNKSHSVAYAIIGYWTAWAKYHHPAEFICASLSYGDEEDKSSLIKEAQSRGMRIVTPKVSISDSTRWIVLNNNLYMPFIEIKGIGEKEAEKCLTAKILRQGFLSTIGQTNSSFKNSTQKALTEIKAFDLKPEARPENCSAYFQFDIGDSYSPPVIKIVKAQAFIDKAALDCTACGLRQQARQVVLSSPGIYNVMAAAEAPGDNEDKEGRGLIGDSGNLLWKELGKHSITRRMIHVGNTAKCFPSKTRKPTKQESNECFNRWLLREIKSMDCQLLLGLGGIVYYALTGNEQGITKASGKIEWIDKIQSWVAWCIHPSYILRRRSSENIQLFEEGIRIFAEQFNKGLGRK